MTFFFAGRTLEELDYMFEARIPTRQFRRFDSTAMLEEKRRQHNTNVADVKTDEPEKIDHIETGSRTGSMV